MPIRTPLTSSTAGRRAAAMSEPAPITVTPDAFRWSTVSAKPSPLKAIVWLEANDRTLKPASAMTPATRGSVRPSDLLRYSCCVPRVDRHFSSCPNETSAARTKSRVGSKSTSASSRKGPMSPTATKVAVSPLDAIVIPPDRGRTESSVTSLNEMIVPNYSDRPVCPSSRSAAGPSARARESADDGLGDAGGGGAPAHIPGHDATADDGVHGGLDRGGGGSEGGVGVFVPEPLQQHGHGHHHPQRIGNALAGDVRGRPVRRLRHRVLFARV